MVLLPKSSTFWTTIYLEQFPTNCYGPAIPLLRAKNFDQYLKYRRRFHFHRLLKVIFLEDHWSDYVCPAVFWTQNSNVLREGSAKEQGCSLHYFLS